jgi:DNA-binding GntR family transcriptional regulator
MKIEKISTKTMRQQIYDQLRKKIISSEILPGQSMTLQGLAKEFGVSLMPVREALWQLESEKVIVIQSNKGIYVNALKRKEMEEIFEIRMILESRAAERSCERIAAHQLSQLKNVLEGMEASLDKPRRYIALNSQFHFMIYSYADSPVLLQIIDALWARIGPYLYIAGVKTGDQSFPMKCHRGMVESLVGRDKKKLKEWLCEDLKWAANFIIPSVEESLPGREQAS